ncbi:hypothetical protein, partial [Salmonella enterica]|uniref:hypothetical protein n=1 Tax=Salmonella enterica TaxID=28901 RepID=UPI000647741C
MAAVLFPAAQITPFKMQRRVALAPLQLGDITAAGRALQPIYPHGKRKPPAMGSPPGVPYARTFSARNGGCGGGGGGAEGGGGG